MLRHALLTAASAGLLLLGGGCAWIGRDKRIREPLRAVAGVEEPAFARSAGALLGAPLLDGNDVVELLNGDRIFGAMLKSIEEAKTSITIEQYIWSSGKVSDKFVVALSEKAKNGVKVHVTFDAVGSMKLSAKDIHAMAKAGVQFAKYHPVISPRFPFRTNHRTHRKLMVVDGRTAFIGGVCVSDDWAGDADPPHWRDTHFKVRGPVVAQIQAVFMENWVRTRSEALHGTEYFPPLASEGSMKAQFVKSGPRDSAENTRLGYLMSIAAARKNIRIAHAYFAPDTLMIEQLLDARRRGVEVEIIVAGKIDNRIVQKAARPRWKKLLEAGVKFYEYQKTLYHCKIMIVDDVWSVVGSVNFDDRSLKIDDEANLQVLDRALAKKLIESFEADKRDSRPLTEKDMKKRNIFLRFTDHFMGLFRAQL